MRRVLAAPPTILQSYNPAILPPTTFTHQMNLLQSIAMCVVLLMASATHAQTFDWVRTVNGTVMDECTDVVVSERTGFVYTAGYFTAAADFPNGTDTLTVSSFNNCAYVAKYTIYGDIVWMKTLPTYTSGKSKGNGIAVDANDNVIVVGEFSGSVDFDPADSTENIQTASNSDAFIWKLDSDGNYQWVKRVNSSYEVAAYGVTADTSNHIVFSGLFTGTTGMPGQFSISDNDNRGYLCKLDSAGAFLWVNSLADIPGNIYPNNVRCDADNNYYVAGAYEQNSAPFIGFLQKVSTDGQDSWRVEMGNPSGVGFINDVVCTPYGVMACGSFKNQATIGNAVGSHIVTSNGPFYDAVVFKLNPVNGQPVWSTTFGSSADDSGAAIHSDANGNVYVAGRFQGTANYANIPQATVTANGSDTYVWKLDYTGEGTGAYTLTNGVDDEITPIALYTATDGAIYLAGRSYGTTDFNQELMDVEEHTSYGYSDGFLHRTTDCDAFLQPPAEELFFCFGDSIAVDGVYYSEPQLIITDSLISQWGCDSLVSVQLTTYSTEEYASYTGCYGDSVLISTGMVFEPGLYVSEYTSSQGCDSSYYEYVDWITSDHFFEQFTLCRDSLLTIYNQEITEGGDYQFLIENTQTTCLDTVSVSVGVIALNDTVTQIGNLLIAPQTADDYAWLDCSSDTLITGENSPQFYPEVSGSYAVIMTDLGCVSTGPCVDITLIHVNEQPEGDLLLYPNPASGQCYLRSTGASISLVVLSDMAGKTVHSSGTLPQSQLLYALPLQSLPSGIYTLRVMLSNDRQWSREVLVD